MQVDRNVLLKSKAEWMRRRGLRPGDRLHGPMTKETYLKVKHKEECERLLEECERKKKVVHLRAISALCNVLTARKFPWCAFPWWIIKTTEVSPQSALALVEVLDLYDVPLDVFFVCAFHCSSQNGAQKIMQ